MALSARRALTLALALLAAPAGSAQDPLFGSLREMLPGDAHRTLALAFGDIDGDGDLDLFAGQGGDQYGVSTGEQNRLYRNDGTGTFTDVTATHMPVDTDATIAVAFGDVDGDGDLDALVGNQTSCTRIYQNDGAGRFRVVASCFATEYVWAVALEDVDGDGDLDAFLGLYGDWNRLFFNDGAGRFTIAPRTNLPDETDATTSVAFGDVDGDGDPDAYLGNSGAEWNRLHLNDGSGVFRDVTATQLPRANHTTFGVTMGDVDADGDLDVMVGNYGGNHQRGEQNHLYLNDGTGRFTDVTSTHVPASSETTWALAFGDADGDGDLDAFAANYRTTQWEPMQNTLWLNDGMGRFTDGTATQLPQVADYSYALALGDVDGDGDLDGVIGNGGWALIGGSPNHLYLNDGSGRFSNAAGNALLDDSRTRLAAVTADFDGDGDRDVMVGGDGPNRVFRNDGTGRFRDVTAASIPTLDDHTTSLAAGDVDGDGDVDMMVGNWAEQNLLLLNDGTGRFTDATATHLPAIREYTSALALGDVDGDGDLDAVIGNGYGDQWGTRRPKVNRLYRNDGRGVFTVDVGNMLEQTLFATLAVAMHDVDADGDLDVLTANYSDANRLFVNDGTGAFTDASLTQLPPLVHQTTSLAIGDLNGDGSPDIAFGNDGQRTEIYFNWGNGVFFRPLRGITNNPDSTWDVELADFDGDGDLDLWEANCGQPNRLFRGDGTGQFVDSGETVFPTDSDATRTLAVADLDGDGDADAFLGRPSPYADRVYTNLTRQLAWRGVPRIGKPLTVDVYGAPRGLWVAMASLGTAAIPTPFGTLRLDPSSHVLAGTGALDANGRAAVTVPVPNDPGLVGGSVYWQAVVMTPIRLTNLEITTFTSL